MPATDLRGRRRPSLLGRAYWLVMAIGIATVMVLAAIFAAYLCLGLGMHYRINPAEFIPAMMPPLSLIVWLLVRIVLD